MDNFKEIDQICKNLLTIKLYNNSQYDKLKEEEKIDKIINKDYIKKCLKNINETYNILYYSIIFKEDKIDDLIDNVIILLITNINEDRYNPIDKIIELAPIITDFTAIEMIEKIKLKDFDYRYHILKRKEISDYLKEEILEEYSIEEIDENINKLRLIINQKIIERNIIVEDDINKYKDLENDIIVYEIFTKYKLNLKKMIKT